MHIDIEEKIILLPFQKDLLKNTTEFNTIHFNRLLQLKPSFEDDYLEDIIASLLNTHDTFRLKFSVENGEWIANVEPLSQNWLDGSFIRIDLEGIAESDIDENIQYCCKQALGSLDIFTGELIKIIYFEGIQNRRIFIVVHQLAMDPYSWSVFLSDFNNSYQQLRNNQKVENKQNRSIRNVSTIINQYSSGASLEKQKEYWLHSLNNPWVGSVPFDYPTTNKTDINHTVFLTKNLSSEKTYALLETCNACAGIELVDLLLTALLKAIEEKNGQAYVRVLLEDRFDNSTIGNKINLNQVAGCLTYSYPLTLSAISNLELPELLLSVQEQRTNIPGKGYSYPFLKDFKQDEQILQLSQNTENWIRFSIPAEEYSLSIEDCFTKVETIATENPGQEILSNYLLDINTSIVKGELLITIAYHDNQYHESTINGIADSFIKTLEKTAADFQEENTDWISMSDLLQGKMNRFEIEDLLFRYSRIEGVYPASVAQLSALYHDSVRLKTLTDQFVFYWEKDLDEKIFLQSCQLLSEEYPALRTAFYGEFPHLYNVIVPKMEVIVSFTDHQDLLPLSSGTYLDKLRQNKIHADAFPLWNIFVLPTNENAKEIILNIHSGLIDHNSANLLYRKLICIYQTLSAGHPYNRLAEPNTAKEHCWYKDEDKEAAWLFWETEFDRIENPTALFTRHDLSSHFSEYESPLSNLPVERIHSFFESNAVTIQSLLYTAWAYFLHCCTNEKTVCFGSSAGSESSKGIGVTQQVLPFIFDFRNSNLSILDYLQQTEKESRKREKHSGIISSFEMIERYELSEGMPFDSTFIFDTTPLPFFSLQKKYSNYVSGYNIHITVSAELPHHIYMCSSKLPLEGSLGKAISTQLNFIVDHIISNPGAPLNSLFHFRKKIYDTFHKELSINKSEQNTATTFDHEIDLNQFDHTIRETKIRGFKVSLGRIEEVLKKVKNVSSPVVVVDTLSETGKTNLLACLSYDSMGDKEEIENTIRKELSKALPSYMIPQNFHFMNTKSGTLAKEDKIKPSIEKHNPGSVSNIFKDQLEETVFSIWQEVLGTKNISVNDDFYSLGGNSLKAIRIFSKLKLAGLPLSMLDLFESKSISELADKIRKGRIVLKLERSENIRGLGKLLPFQLFHLKNLKEKAWNISSLFSFNDRMNAKTVHDALNVIYLYHDALRIQFTGDLNSSNLQGVKMINRGYEECTLDFQVIHLEHLDQVAFHREMNRDISDLKIKNRFDNENLSAFRIYRSAEGDSFYMMVSHLICDGISFQLIQNDFFHWYAILQSNGKITLPKKTDSYISASKKIFDYANSNELLREIPFWEEFFACFSNNNLLPKDHTIHQTSTSPAMFTIESKLLGEKELVQLEQLCILNQTTIIDLVLVAFGAVLKDWCGIDSLGVLFINSGRQYTHLDIDVSRTVGSFAIARYLKVDNSNDLNLVQKSALHKKQREQVPNGGLGGNLLLDLEYYREINTIFHLLKKLYSILPEKIEHVKFNYFDNTSKETIENNNALSEEALVKSMNESGNTEDLFKIELYHSNDKLLLNWTCSTRDYNQATIETLLNALQKKLLLVIAR